MTTDAHRLLELVSAGDAERVRGLLEAGVAPDALDDDEGETALVHAVRHGWLEIVRILLAFRANPERALWAALWPCTDPDDPETLPPSSVEMLIALLDAGANANGHWQDESALYLAAKHPALLRVLLDRGADPNRPTASGETPLSFCCDWGRSESVRVLLAGGADPNYVMPDLDWPMTFFAAQGGHLEVLDALLDAGSDPLYTNERGQTALSVALDHRKSKFAEHLLDRVPGIVACGTVDLVAEARRIPNDDLARRIDAARQR